MAFRVVERPVIRPMHCAALPQRGQTAEGERWVDTGAELPGFDNHVYLSETAVKEAGRVLGFPSPGETQAQAAKVEALEAELSEAKRRIDYLHAALDASKVVEQYIESLTKPEPKQPAEEAKPNGSK